MIMLAFLFVLNSNFATKIAAIIKVEYIFVINVEILDLIVIDMVVTAFVGGAEGQPAVLFKPAEV